MKVRSFCSENNLYALKVNTVDPKSSEFSKKCLKIIQGCFCNPLNTNKLASKNVVLEKAGSSYSLLAKATAVAFVLGVGAYFSSSIARNSTTAIVSGLLAAGAHIANKARGQTPKTEPKQVVSKPTEVKAEKKTIGDTKLRLENFTGINPKNELLDFRNTISTYTLGASLQYLKKEHKNFDFYQKESGENEIPFWTLTDTGQGTRKGKITPIIDGVTGKINEEKFDQFFSLKRYNKTEKFMIPILGRGHYACYFIDRESKTFAFYDPTGSFIKEGKKGGSKIVLDALTKKIVKDLNLRNFKFMDYNPADGNQHQIKETKKADDFYDEKGNLLIPGERITTWKPDCGPLIINFADSILNKPQGLKTRAFIQGYYNDKGIQNIDVINGIRKRLADRIR